MEHDVEGGEGHLETETDSWISDFRIIYKTFLEFGLNYWKKKTQMKFSYTRAYMVNNVINYKCIFIRV